MAFATTAIPEYATAVLVLADGRVFFGKGCGVKGERVGEICFNTGLTGYQETLTDPSYAGQIITFTFPHIGNVGINQEDMEALKPHVKGFITRERITPPSNFRCTNHLQNWLEEQEVVGITGVDTRALTRHIRKNGPQNATILHFGNEKRLCNIEVLQEKAKAMPSLKGMELAKGVTCEEIYQWDQRQWHLSHGHRIQGEVKFKVVAYDFGAKHNILRCLSELGCDVKVVPATTTAEEVMELNPDGIFLSNGPGDPAATGEYALPHIKELVKTGLPMFGICLGHQLISLALGCTTIKMHQGHRGANHPVQDLKTEKVEITSQNHGFVVEEKNLPKDVEVTHRSLFDGTVEGIRSKSKPIFTVQYHPEASPGTHDSFYLFERFIAMMEAKHA